MPQVEVTPESLAESPTGGPVIAGVAFRRPTERGRTYEPVRSVVTLAGGETRAYDSGLRLVVTLRWSKLTAQQVAHLAGAVASPFTTYADDADSEVLDVSTEEGLEVDAVPGTFPIRYEANLTLKERRPRR